jgi:uncharacterized membrane protein YhaH (DUF805 family)
MTMSINWGHLLFSFSGRINRAKWWLTILVMVVMQIALEILQLVVPGLIAAILAFLFFVVVLWISLAAGTKRLHDLGRTGAWLILFFLVPILLGIVLVVDFVLAIGAEALASMNEEEMLNRFTDPALWQSVGLVALVVGVLIFVIEIWQLIWFGCLRGTAGSNRYGPDPLIQQATPGYPR